MGKPNGSAPVNPDELKASIVNLAVQIAEHQDAIKALKKAHAETVQELRVWQRDQQRPILLVSEVLEEVTP